MSRLRDAAIVLSLLETGCSGEPASEPNDRSMAIAPGEHFELSFTGSSTPTGRLLGWNVGRGTFYAPEGDTLHPEWRKSERVEAVRRLAEIRAAQGPAPYVRFSGLQIDGSLGGFGSGTAGEAARYATYLFGVDGSVPEVAARTGSGHEDPYSKNGGDPAWFGMAADNPEDFAARALEYIRAIQTIEPEAKFWVPLSQASMDAWGGLDVSLAALTPLLREPAVESVVVHFYEVDDAKTLGFTEPNSPELTKHYSTWRCPSRRLRTSLVEDWYNPFRSEGGILHDMPSFSVTRLFAEHLLPARVDMVAKTMRTADATLAGAEYDAVQSVAFASDDRKVGTVFLVQRDAPSGTSRRCYGTTSFGRRHSVRA